MTPLKDRYWMPLALFALLIAACGGEEPTAMQEDVAKGDGTLQTEVTLTTAAPEYEAPCVDDRTYSEEETWHCEEGYYPVQCNEWFSCNLTTQVTVVNGEDFRDMLIGRCDRNEKDQCSMVVARMDLDRFNYLIWLHATRVGDEWHLHTETTLTSQTLAPDRGIKWSVSRSDELYLLDIDQDVTLSIKFSWE